MTGAGSARHACRRCRRPSGHCFCALIATLVTRTRVVFLQHPRERRVAIGTARMAHLALPNSELHEGISFAGHAAVAAIIQAPGAAVLFPSDLRDSDRSGIEPTSLSAPPSTLIVVDGTWPQARKLLRANPLLGRLPRIALRPEQPGRYRIRREPYPECLATVEAVAAALALLEGDRDRFEAMLAAFSFMVERQLACVAAERAPRRRAGRAGPPPLPTDLAAFVDAADDIVLIHGEANAQGVRERVPGRPELLHLVAYRPAAAGQRFEAFLAPRRPLGHRTALHLDLDPARLILGEPVAPALARFDTFVGPRARLCGWGSVAADLLAREGLRPRPCIDLRAIIARHLPGHSGGLPAAAAALDAEVAPRWASGRAGRMLAWLTAVHESLWLACRAHVERTAAGHTSQRLHLHRRRPSSLDSNR
jgi:DTW domain-containing protein YfiP